MSVEQKVEYREKGEAFEFWGEGPPPPPDEETIVKDLSCQGTIAFALRETLLELQAEQVSSAALMSSTKRGEDSACEDKGKSLAAGQSDVSTKPPLHLHPNVVDRIMHSFGKEVAKSQQHTDIEGSTSSTSSLPLKHRGPEPPAALLRGKLEYYNRRNNKWRFVIKDAELAERPILEKYRRKRERPSLWLVSEEQNTKRSNKFDLELLAFNDIE